MIADHAAAAIATARAFAEIGALRKQLERENEYLREEVTGAGAFGLYASYFRRGYSRRRHALRGDGIRGSRRTPVRPPGDLIGQPLAGDIWRQVPPDVPARLKESSYALGSTTWEVVWDIVLPYTRSAVIGGIFLGLGRALGETMAVTFVLGNSYNLTTSLLMPGTSISSSIANEFNEAVGLHRSALIALGFLLFVVTFIVLLIARLMLRQLARREGR